MNLKKLIRDNEAILDFVSHLSHIFGNNRIRSKGLKWDGSITARCRFVDNGSNNNIYIGKRSRLYNCSIEMYGNNNIVDIKNDCELRNVNIWISDESKIVIGHNTWFTGNTHIACIERTSVNVGKRCLFSNDITIRTGDSHSITDNDGNRINPSKNIIIGEHVWIGQRVIILKGANIGDNSVIGTGSIVTGKKYMKNSVIAGLPAKEIKNFINWDSRLL